MQKIIKKELFDEKITIKEYKITSFGYQWKLQKNFIVRVKT